MTSRQFCGQSARQCHRTRSAGWLAASWPVGVMHRTFLAGAELNTALPHPRGHPLASRCQVENTLPAPRFHRGAMSFLCPALLLVAPVFSVFGCEAIAPVTHQDQANRRASPAALAASAAPEKHWFRRVSQFLNSSRGCRLRPHPLLAHAPGDSLSCSGGGARRPISADGLVPTPGLARLRRHDRHAKQRFSSNAVCPFSM